MRPCCPLLVLAFLGAAEPTVAIADGLPPVPNPYGFDARLALRTHLEEAFNQRDVAHLGWEALVARYHALVAPAPAPAPIAPPPAPGRDEAAAAERVRRDNLLLQLERQFGITPLPGTPTDELQRLVDRCVQEGREAARPSPPPPPPAGGTVVRRPPAGPEPAAAPAALTLNDPSGVLASVVAERDGRRCLAVCFSPDLLVPFPETIAAARHALARAHGARNALILLGHGDGTRIGVDTENPIELARHLRANREAYEAAAGGRLDCVALISCSPASDTQFLAFRDGLGYYPQWRVSAWERTNQTIGSAIAALELALATPREQRLRAVVYHGEARDLASLGEVGERTATTWFQVDLVGDALRFSPVRRR